MMRISKIFHAAGAAVLMLSLQNLTAQELELGCDDIPGFADFDFWVGEWDVFDLATGNRVGTNSIQREEIGCMVVERWESNQGVTGTSINYFNPVLDEWRQVWISAGRYAIDITGGLQGDYMVLVGSAYYYNGTQAEIRGTWTPNEDGSVRQFFEQKNADTDEWEPWFDGRYVRQS